MLIHINYMQINLDRMPNFIAFSGTKKNDSTLQLSFIYLVLSLGNKEMN